MGRGPSMKAVKGFKRTQARKAAEGDKRKTNAKLAQRKREKEDKMISAVKMLSTEKRQKVEPAPARSASRLAAEVPTGEKVEKVSSQSFKKGGKKPGKGKRRILSADEKHEMKMTGPIGAVLRHCEVFRRDDCEPAERERRIGEVLKTLRKEVDGLAAAAVKLNTARVLQSCIKHGTPAQQDSIIEELKGKLVDLSQNQAASHVLLSMYSNCKMTQLKALSRAFAEQTATLVKHRVGVRVLDAAFVNSNRTDQRAFVVYAVGRPDVVMESNKGEKTLEQVWEANPRSKTVSLQALFGRVDAAVSRGLVDYGIVHRLLDVYFTHGMQDQCVELAKQLIDKTAHFCNDQYGSKVALRTLEYVGPEERASLIGTLSDSILPMSCGRHSYLLAGRIIDATDDTTFVRDQFLRELVRPDSENKIPAIQELVTSVAGSKVLLHLLTPVGERKVKLLQPAHGSLLWSLRATPTSEVSTQVTVETRRPGAGAVSVENRVVSETDPGPRHDLALAFLLRPGSSAFQGGPTQDEVGLLDLLEGGDVTLLMRDTQARRVLYELVNFSNAVPAGWTVTQGVLKEAKKTLAQIDGAYKAVHSAMEAEGKKRKGGQEESEEAGTLTKLEKTKKVDAKEEVPEKPQKKAPTKPPTKKQKA